MVRSHGGNPGATFDYVVYGLRIGFEESSIVQEKRDESFIPSMKDHRQLYERRPELRSFNALERFKRMETAKGQTGAIDLSRADALKAAVHEYDATVDGPAANLLGPETGIQRPVRPPAVEEREPSTDLRTVKPVATTDRVAPQAALAAGLPHVQQTPAAANLFSVSEALEAGDLLVLDPARPGELRKAVSPADPGVVGISAGDAYWEGDQRMVQVVDGLYAVVKADASYGAIRPGDLLVASPTPGHAMRASAPALGTVIGKALESLESGAGVVRVAVMPR